MNLIVGFLDKEEIFENCEQYRCGLIASYGQKLVIFI